jgi:hypothetical protein
MPISNTLFGRDWLISFSKPSCSPRESIDNTPRRGGVISAAIGSDRMAIAGACADGFAGRSRCVTVDGGAGAASDRLGDSVSLLRPRSEFQMLFNDIVVAP